MRGEGVCDGPHTINDLFQRVEPGEQMPAGTCPTCGALCHLTTDQALSQTGPVVASAGRHALRIAAKWPADGIRIDVRPAVGHHEAPLLIQLTHEGPIIDQEHQDDQRTWAATYAELTEMLQ